MEIKPTTDEEVIIKLLEFARSCIKRANHFPNQRSRWLRMARDRITEVNMLLDDELEYRDEQFKMVEGIRNKHPLNMHK